MEKINRRGEDVMPSGDYLKYNPEKNPAKRPEVREKMRLAKLKNPVRYWLGKHFEWSKEARRKASNSLKGHPNYLKHQTKEARKKISKTMKGRKLSEETKKKLSELNKIRLSNPKNNSNWKGGITPLRQKIRNSNKFKEWKKSVLKRDNYICTICDSKEHLEVDHIKPFSKFPKLRFDINNGRTLCRDCHIKTDTYGGRLNG